MALYKFCIIIIIIIINGSETLATPVFKLGWDDRNSSGLHRVRASRHSSWQSTGGVWQVFITIKKA